MATAATPILLAPRSATVWLALLWARSTALLLRVVVGTDWTMRGRENLPTGPFILAIKHQSAWDTLMYALMVKNPAIVLKRELTWIPVVGWYFLKNQMIPVDRGSGASAIRKMLKAAKARLDEGRPIVIAPEGTRTAPDQRVPYHPGVAALYSHLKVPVVPAALNAGLFWSRRGFLKRPGTIVVEFLDPIAPGLDRQIFLEQLSDVIENATDKLIAEARAKDSRLRPVDSGDNT